MRAPRHGNKICLVIDRASLPVECPALDIFINILEIKDPILIEEDGVVERLEHIINICQQANDQVMIITNNNFMRDMLVREGAELIVGINGAA